MILRLATANENLLLLRNSLARIPGTARILLMWGRGIAPVPTSYFPEPFRLGPVPHTGHLPRAIKLHRQNTSLDQGVASWDGAMPRPHM